MLRAHSALPVFGRAVSLASEARTARYLNIALLSAYVWDWSLSVSDECTAIRRCRSWPSSVAYFLSRIGVVASLITSFILQTAPSTIDHCASIYFLEVTLGITTSATSFLFLTRIRAVYERSRIVTTIFGAFWLAIVISSVGLIIMVKRNNVEGTQQCTPSKIGPQSMCFLWVKAAYDTATFVAISHRMVSFSREIHPSRTSLWSRARGQGLSQLGRDILQDGQFYYFVNITITISAAVVVMLPINDGWRFTLSEPALSLESAMACRVFRRVLLRPADAEVGPSTSATVQMTTIMEDSDLIYDNAALHEDNG
ncbi:hypothetical protein FIBSPDRAFT_965911 [Athelia psychrophila]|uniref:DUF6533 domain-containing protein n=1 Tax=Athelia psychrophila TaxID=1759441 RepID=A0A167XEA4_9AGAM|nr:hypothetical protein FIBSPDRAFT_965911 [Fibularhizoctonia sp. CBS 109695]